VSGVVSRLTLLKIVSNTGRNFCFCFLRVKTTYQLLYYKDSVLKVCNFPNIVDFPCVYSWEAGHSRCRTRTVWAWDIHDCDTELWPPSYWWFVSLQRSFHGWIFFQPLLRNSLLFTWIVWEYNQLYKHGVTFITWQDFLCYCDVLIGLEIMLFPFDMCRCSRGTMAGCI
jgi:hypothetical protein